MHRNVGELLKPEGLLLITSCNWTEEELRQFCDDGDVDDEDNIDEEDDNDEDHDDLRRNRGRGNHLRILSNLLKC